MELLPMLRTWVITKCLLWMKPNIRFTTAEKQLYWILWIMVADFYDLWSYMSDRNNNDGWDSPAIWNDFMTNNGSVSNPFGISFDPQFLPDFPVTFLNSSTDPILHGSWKCHRTAGTMPVLPWPWIICNSSVKGLIFKTGSSTSGTSNVLFAGATMARVKCVESATVLQWMMEQEIPNDALLL